MLTKQIMEKNTVTTRPPIVAILGHVDHGKTSLLDKIRKTAVASREAGGITQSIGAWQVEVPKSLPAGRQGGEITFIDTPGHEAFGKMRSRGAAIADIAILVVAADDGVMPQTVESLQYIKEAKIPFLVAITKVDIVGVEPEKVKAQLADNGILLEGRGGDVVAVEVSSVTGKGIDDLLEMILLVSQMHEIKGSPEDVLEVPVIETLMDRRRGPVVRVIVRAGTLNAGDIIGFTGYTAKVRGLFNEKQESVKSAFPGMPVEILGFETLPPVGAVLTVSVGASATTVQQEKLNRNIEGLPIILKTDTAGSLEAIENKLPLTGLPAGRQVGVKLSGTGDISESDVLLASTTNAVIVGFNVRAPKDILKLAENEGVKIYTYKIIYELLADVDKWLKEKEEVGERVLGRAQIIAEFPHDKKKIAGAKVTEGRITKSDKLRLVKAGEVIGDIRSVSLKKQKLDVDKVSLGDEFGMLFEPQLDFKIGDVIESWQ